MKLKIDPISEAEQVWVTKQIAGATEFIRYFSPRDADHPVSLSSLDRAYTAWVATNETDTELVNSIINVVGITFGSLLVNGIGLNWVIATDEHGTDLAVYRLSDQGDTIVIFPASFVAKRWQRKETNLLQYSYEQIARQVTTWDARVGKQLAKPWWKFW